MLNKTLVLAWPQYNEMALAEPTTSSTCPFIFERDEAQPNGVFNCIAVYSKSGLSKLSCIEEPCGVIVLALVEVFKSARLSQATL